MHPLEIRLSPDKATLTVRFEQATHALPAEYLRVESPSAEVKGHGPGQEKLVTGKHGVTITGLEPVGNYALKIIFSDGHSTGLYTWATLEELGREYSQRWQTYQNKCQAAALAAKAPGRV